MRRLLILSYIYAPTASPRAFRWHSLARHWRAQGYVVDVVTAHVHGAAQWAVLDGVSVYRTGPTLADRLLPGPRAGTSPPGTRATPSATAAGAAARSGGGSPRSAAAALKWVYDRTWKRVYWPDYACAWIPAGFALAARLLRSHQYDALVTVSLPFSAHVVGLLLHAAGRRAGVWLADAGDPFALMGETPVNNQRLYGRLNLLAERAVLRRVRALAVTTPETAARYRTAFPESAPKVHVIPPLLSAIGASEPNTAAAAREADPAAQPANAGTKTTMRTSDRPLRLVFLGTLFRAIRSPAVILRVLAELLRAPAGAGGPTVELHMYGSENDCQSFFEPYAHLMGRQLFVHGQVSRERAAAAMQEADVLVNIGNRTSYQLPSKLIEYAATGKPILNLASSAQDSSVSFLRSYPAGFNLITPAEDAPIPPEEMQRLREFLERREGVDTRTLEHWLSAFRPPAIAAAYERLLGWRDGGGLPTEVQAAGAAVAQLGTPAGGSA